MAEETAWQDLGTTSPMRPFSSQDGSPFLKIGYTSFVHCTGFPVDRQHLVPDGGVLHCRWYDCYSDEHFLPVLLTMHGRERETYCSGNLMHVNWAQGGAHPTAYRTGDISVDLCGPAHPLTNSSRCCCRALLDQAARQCFAWPTWPCNDGAQPLILRVLRQHGSLKIPESLQAQWACAWMCLIDV